MYVDFVNSDGSIPFNLKSFRINKSFNSEFVVFRSVSLALALYSSLFTCFNSADKFTELVAHSFNRILVFFADSIFSFVYYNIVKLLY